MLVKVRVSWLLNRLSISVAGFFEGCTIG